MKPSFRFNHLFNRIAFVWTVAFWCLCIAIPLGAVLSGATIGSTSDSTWGSAWRSLFDPVVLAVAGATFKQALCSMFLSGGIGLFFGLWLGKRFSLYSISRVESLLMVPNGVPTVVIATAWVLWLGRSGILAHLGFHIEWAYSLKAVILAHVFLNVPLVAYLVAQARKAVPDEQLEAARTLGATGLGEFLWVIWPQIRWAFFAACAQVMALCAMSFALVLILGGGPPVQTLETELFEKLRYGYLDMGGALACAIWEMVLTIIPWVLLMAFKKQDSVQTVKKRDDWTQYRFQSRRWMTFLGLVWVLPYFAVINRQTWAGVLRIATNLSWRTQVLESLRVSMSLAGLSSLAAVFTAFAAAISLQHLQTKPSSNLYGIGKVFEVLLGIPSGVSVLVLSLGVWTAYGRWIDPFEGSLFAMVVLQMTLFFPLAFRLLWPVARVRQLPQIESAALLGATPFQVFRFVEWPRWRGPLLAALAGVGGASLGEVGAVSLFYSEKLIPLPLLIARWMQQYRFEDAQTVCGILFLLSFMLIVGSLELGRRLC